MAIDVSVETEIARPAPAVAAYMFEPSNDPKWIGGISSAELLTPRPVGKGTQVRRLAGFMGKTIDYILEVDDFVPDQLMLMRSVKSPFPMVVTYRIEKISEERARVSIRIEGNAKGFYGFLSGLFMKPMVRRNVNGDLQRMKKILES